MRELTINIIPQNTLFEYKSFSNKKHYPSLITSNFPPSPCFFLTISFSDNFCLNAFSRISASFSFAEIRSLGLSANILSFPCSATFFDTARLNLDLKMVLNARFWLKYLTWLINLYHKLFGISSSINFVAICPSNVKRSVNPHSSVYLCKKSFMLVVSLGIQLKYLKRRGNH